MKHILLLCLILLTLGHTGIAYSTTMPQDEENEKKAYINDRFYSNSLKLKVASFASDSTITAIETLTEQLKTRKTCNIDLNKTLTATPFNYDALKHSVLGVGEVFTCNKCPEHHLITASAFVISEDGICVTNYHVFDMEADFKADILGIGIINYAGKVFKVKEILAASKENDVAIFRIDTKGKLMSALRIGQEQGAGEAINLISHPAHRFYTYTQGHIDRKYIKPGSTKIRQSISAEFAKGSSGAPIMDNCGNVVGVVAGTQNIYYDQEGKVYQSTIKEIIPVSRLKELIN